MNVVVLDWNWKYQHKLTRQINANIHMYVDTDRSLET